MPMVGAGAVPIHGPSRTTPRLLLWLALGLLAARVAAGVYEKHHAPKVAELVEWQPIATAAEKARATGMPILYNFTAEWCPPCHVMEREVFSDRRAAATINGMFVPVRVQDRVREEGHNPPDVAALEARYKVEAFPTLVIVSPEGGQPVVLPGYGGKQALMRELTRAGTRVMMAKPGMGGGKADSVR